MNHAKLFILFILCMLLPGCAAMQRTLWQPAPGQDAAPLLARDWLRNQDRQMLRLEGRLRIGSRKISLAALLRRDGERRTARLVLMGDMGMTLCDMDVTPSGHITHSSVPDLEQAPRVLGHVARTVRRLFLLPLPGDDAPVWKDGNEFMLRCCLPDLEVERVYAADTALLHRLQAPEQGWRADFSDYSQYYSDGLPFPRQIEYRDSKGGYTLQLLLVSLKPAT